MCHPALYSRLPLHPDPPGARVQLLEAVEGLLHLFPRAHDADLRLHHVLQVELHLIRPLGIVAGALERREGLARQRLDLILRRLHRRLRAGVLGRVPAGALAEDQEVGQRVPPEPVRAVQTRRALAGREQPGHVGHLAVGVDAHPPIT